MPTFQPRLTASGLLSSDYWIADHSGFHGKNNCIVIDHTTGSVLPNCVGYAWGRAYEIMEHMGVENPRPLLSNNDAWRWWQDDARDPYQRGQTPRLGAIACWYNSLHPTSGGHVAVVEQITDTTITVSNSAYGGDFFWTSVYYIGEYNHGNYVFQGFIYLPIDTPVPPPPVPVTSTLKIMFYPTFF